VNKLFFKFKRFKKGNKNMESVIDCRPSVRGEIKKARHSGYDFFSSIFEFVDNACDTDCSFIRIELKEKADHGYKKLHKIIISDDNFNGIPIKKLYQIFSWTFERERKNNDIGEFGTGFKCASVNLGNSLTIFTYDQRTAKYYSAMADWDNMEENNRWHPQILEIDREFFKDYHPFDFGTSFIIENIRNEFIQNQKLQYHLVEKLLFEIAYHYKYYLQTHSHKKMIIKGLFTDGKKEIEICPTHFFYFFQYAEKTIETKIFVYKDQANFYNFFIQKKNNPKIELVEFIEKRKNGNHHLKCSDISERILETMILIDEILFKSCQYTQNNDSILSFGSCDLIFNNRIVGRDLYFRKPRYDNQMDYVKHEIYFYSKLINPILGIQFNKKSQISINDIYYTFEYVQMYHEKELIKLQNKPIEINKSIESDNKIQSIKIESIPESDSFQKNKRRNFTLETKLVTIKKQECRDSEFDFLLKDHILPMDYDHITDRANNSEDNCQALCVISHAIKTRKPEIFDEIKKNKEKYIIDLLNCLTSSKIFLNIFINKKIAIKDLNDISISNGIFKWL
jgi:hypothetical protein